MRKRGRRTNDDFSNEERGGARRRLQASSSSGHSTVAMWNNPLYQCQQRNAALQARVQGLNHTIQQLKEQLRTVEITIRQEERARCDHILRQSIAAEVRKILNQPHGQRMMAFRRLHNRLLTR